MDRVFYKNWTNDGRVCCQLFFYFFPLKLPLFLNDAKDSKIKILILKHVIWSFLSILFDSVFAASTFH